MSRRAASWGERAGSGGSPTADGPASRPPATIDDVMLRYLAAFGPASVSDMCTWSGLPALREVAARLKPQLRVFLVENDREVLDLPGTPRPDPDLPAPVRFLPEYDNVLHSLDDRSRVNPDARPVPLQPGRGARVGTVLIDGDFRATGQVVACSERVSLSVRAKPQLSPHSVDEVCEEGQRLLGFIAPTDPPAMFTSPNDPTVTESTAWSGSGPWVSAGWGSYQVNGCSKRHRPAGSLPVSGTRLWP